MMGQFGIWLRRWIEGKPALVVSPISLPPPFITTVCTDCGATITFQEPIVAGLAVVETCKCQQKWVAYAPGVIIYTEKQFLERYGKDAVEVVT